MFVENVSVLNDLNVKIFAFSNIDKGFANNNPVQLFDHINITNFVFNNITISSNIGILTNKRNQNFFSFYSPIKPVQILFNNSVFENNNLRTLFWLHLKSYTILEESILDLYESTHISMTISNCSFRNNFVSQSGVILSSNNMRTKMNNLQLLDNVFTNNTCNHKGGLFNFLSVFFDITSINNIYTHNRAGHSGGIGYTYRSELFYFEDNGYYYSKKV